MPTIEESVTTKKTVKIDRDYCLEQAVLCLLGRSQVPPPPFIGSQGGNSYQGQPGQVTTPHDPVALPGPLEWAQAWRDLAAEFPKPR